MASMAERGWQYPRDHGYEYEPDLGVPTRSDFLARRDGVEFVCEVKAFESHLRSSDVSRRSTSRCG